MAIALKHLKPGRRVRITQTIAWGRHKDQTAIDGTIRRLGQQKTGSWFAHARDDKLWIDRIELQRPDGEIVVCNIDQNSVIDLLDQTDADAGTSAGASAGTNANNAAGG